MKKALIIFFLICFKSAYSQVLNEICASNQTGFESDTVGFADWVEIYNEDIEDLNLEGWYLTDKINTPTKWTFPDLEIEEGEYLTLFAKADTDIDSVISFAFKKEGDTLYLLDPSYNIIDVIIHPALHTDDSYGRIGDDLFYFDSPSPNALNDTVLAFNGYTETPTINRPSGAAAKGTHIVIRPINESEAVYYSTRGIIADNLFETDIVLSQTTSIMAVAIGDSLLPSAPIARTYFINEQSSLPVINLTVDSLALFDEVTGITMLGPDANINFPYYGANYWKDIKLNTYYEFFNADFQFLEGFPCELEIHGGLGARTKPLKSFELKASEDDEGLMFNQPFFDEKEITRFNRLILRNSGDDFYSTYMKDGILHKYFIEENLNIDFLGYQPAVVYYNGNYQGILNIREKADKYYIANNYGYDAEDVNVLENWNLVEKAGVETDYRTLWYFARENDLAIEDNYNWVADRIDIPSMMDYFILEVYLNNRDWPNFNLRVWNVPGEEKWRYFCYDLDVSFRYASSDIEDIQFLKYILAELPDVNPHVSILNALFGNPTFEHDFINRYCDLLNTTIRADNIINGILAGKEPVADDMPRHYEKWCGDIDVWHERFNGHIGFINQRADLVRTEMAELFEMPEAINIQIDTYPYRADEIKLNTIDEIELPFEGKYFTTNTIRITATENSGAKFQYWENIRTGELFKEKSIVVDPIEGDHFVAFYETENVFELLLFPNPIEEEGILNYSLPEPAQMKIEIYSLMGIKVYEYIDDEEKLQGGYQFNVLLNDFVAGVYILKFSTAYGEEIIRFVKV